MSHLNIPPGATTTKPLRDGVNQAVSGYGYTVNWDLSPLYEGFYTIRVTAVDTLGRSASASTTVYVEPTPPLPKITSPDNFDNFCPPVDILMSCSDENLSAVNLFYRQGLTDYSIGMGTLYQFDLGDNNGNPYDGNLAANGEFGDYYCAPVAAALAVQVWYDRGYTYLYTPPVTSLAENLATEFMTRENFGTYDEDIIRGLYDYFLPRGAILKFKYERNPDYATMRTWIEFEGRSVIIGLGGNPGVWLALDGFKGYHQTDSTCIITVSNPLTGSLSDLSMRNYYGTNQIYFNYGWKPIDIMISVFASNWTVTSEFIDTDNNDADGWSYNWAPDNLTEMESYYIHATAIDDTNIKGTSTVLTKYDCTNAFLQGDFNNDNQANFADLNYLIAFITQNGAPPVGGIKRGDCNCDNVVNIADIVYYLNFLFGTAGAPCY